MNRHAHDGCDICAEQTWVDDYQSDRTQAVSALLTFFAQVNKLSLSIHELS